MCDFMNLHCIQGITTIDNEYNYTNFPGFPNVFLIYRCVLNEKC